MFHQFTVQELVDQGYTLKHARQFIDREAVRTRTAKASKKARDEARAALPKASVASASAELDRGGIVRPTLHESISEHNAEVLKTTASEAKRRFVMTPARRAALDKAHAARREQAAAKRAESVKALESVTA